MQATIRRILCRPVNWFMGDENDSEHSAPVIIAVYALIVFRFWLLFMLSFIIVLALVLGVLHVLNNDWAKGICCFCCVLLGGFFLWVVYKIKAGGGSRYYLTNSISNDDLSGEGGSSGKNPSQTPAQKESFMSNCMRELCERKGRIFWKPDSEYKNLLSPMMYWGGQVMVVGQFLSLGCCVFMGANLLVFCLTGLSFSAGNLALGMGLDGNPIHDEWRSLCYSYAACGLYMQFLLTVAGGI